MLIIVYMINILLARIIQVYSDNQFYHYASISEYLGLCALYTYYQNPLLSSILYYLSFVADSIVDYQNKCIEQGEKSLLDDKEIENNLKLLQYNHQLKKYQENEWILIFNFYHLVK